MKPEGYKKRGIDLVGFWNPNHGPIHGIPRAAKLFDSNLDASKPSTLLILELVEPCDAIFSKDEDDDAEKVTTQTGDLVGVWSKPGLAAIKTLCGTPVFLQYERDAKGEVVTKRMKKKGMNAMKCFEVLSKTNPMKTIPVLEDSRRESAHVNTLLAPAKSNKPLAPISAPSQTEIEVNNDADDEIPF